MNYPDWVGKKLTIEDHQRQSIQDIDLIFLNQVRRFSDKLHENDNSLKNMTANIERENDF